MVPSRGVGSSSTKGVVGGLLQTSLSSADDTRALNPFLATRYPALVRSPSLNISRRLKPAAMISRRFLLAVSARLFPRLINIGSLPQALRPPRLRSACGQMDNAGASG